MDVVYFDLTDYATSGRTSVVMLPVPARYLSRTMLETPDLQHKCNVI